MNLYATPLIKIVSLFVVIAILLLFLFVFITSINTTHTGGVSYGFEIGATKEVVFNNIPDNARTISDSQNFHVEIFKDQTKVPLQIQTSFEAKDFKLFEESNKWKVFFDTNFFFDNITLTFCGDELCEVKRKRQFFEIP